MKVAEKTYYLNADKSKALPALPFKEPRPGEAFDETPEGAAYLLVRKGVAVTPEMEEKYGIKGVEQEEVKAEAGIVTSAVGDSNGQGFIPAAEAREAGLVVTEGQDEAEASEPEAPKTPTKKAAAKAASKKK